MPNIFSQPRPTPKRNEGWDQIQRVIFNPGDLVRGKLDASDSDTDSILSSASDDTIDDNPGTGRTIDTYVYQKFGRKIERVIYRTGMSLLSPARIMRYIIRRKSSNKLVGISFSAYPDMGQLVGHLTLCYGPAVLAGLKSLVNQARQVTKVS